MITPPNFTSFADGVPVTVSDRLIINIKAPDGTRSFDLVLRVLDSNGKLIETTETITVTITGATIQRVIPLVNGILTFASLQTSNSAYVLGQCFANMIVRKGQSQAIPPGLQIASGYITADNPLIFPTLTDQNAMSLLGGWLETEPTQPAAGAGFTYTPAANESIAALSFDLATGAAVATRQVRLSWLGGTFEKGHAIANATQLASLTRRYFLWRGPNLPAAAGSNIYIPFPDVILLTPDTIVVTVDNIQAADQISAIVAQSSMQYADI